MADDIESELEAQLASQREALAGINEAIGFAGDNTTEGHAELQQMRIELQTAVLELEAALLEIKRARILQQFATHNPSCPSTALTPGISLPPPPAGAPLPAGAGSPYPTAGNPCHFRYLDGRWYVGRVLGPGRQASTLSVAFEVPTRLFMLDPVDIMEALVRPCSDPAAAPAALLGTRTGCSPPGGGTQQRQRQHQQQAQEPGGGSRATQGDVAVGRKALARLPGSRLYVPVEVVALNAARATATVLPLQPPLHLPQGRAGGSSTHSGGEVIVPLSLVTRHAHAAPPSANVGEGGGGNGSDNDDEDGGGGSNSSSSVSALLRPAIGGGESGEEDGDEDGGQGIEGNDGESGESDGDAKEEMDMYESHSGDDGDDGDDGGSGSGGKNRGEGRSSTHGVRGDTFDHVDATDGALDVFEHARLAAAAGTLDDAALLADWESHGRGVASRLLVRMGYVQGQGLGSRGQGTMAAPEVLLLPERKGLGSVDKDRLRRVGGGAAGGGKLQGGVNKRRSKRGGARQKRKQAIVAAREARREVREVEEGAPGGGGLFDFINSSLGDCSAAARIRKAQVSVAGIVAGSGGGGAPQTAGAAAIAGAVAAASGGPPRRGPDRRGLMSQHDKVAAIQTKLSRLHEMLGRHKDNRGLRTQIEAEMRTVQGELASAQSAAAHASKAIHDKDVQKKWLKF